MANVRVEQRNAHLASPVRLETVHGRDGDLSKATLTAISNSRRGSGESREDEPTAIQWTLWGKQADNAAQYLGKGCHVNVVGRLRNNHFNDADGQTIFGFSFTCEEIDYLDSKAESEARKRTGAEASPPAAAAVPSGKLHPNSRSCKALAPRTREDNVPF